MSVAEKRSRDVADGTKRRLRRSVLSSCSERPLVELMREVRGVSRVRLFDLLILRGIDIWQIEPWLKKRDRPPLQPPRPRDMIDTRSSTQILAEEENFPSIRDWILEQIEGADRDAEEGEEVRMAALATFFPDIASRSQGSSADPPPREVAVRALSNTVRLALALKRQGKVAESFCWAPGNPDDERGGGLDTSRRRRRRYAIVEMVCGTVLDRCRCSLCENLRRPQNADPSTGRRPASRDYAIECRLDAKIELLRDSLQQVYRSVAESPEGREDHDWALAMELEPGPAYVLRDSASIDVALRKLDGELARHVGLNLDIAHMKIAGVPVETTQGNSGLSEFKDRVVHAHLCDHPDMHTRDQVVGSWQPVEQYGDGRYAYVELLSEIANAERRGSELPFSGAVALELEGCNRIRWIHQSLSGMKHMFERVSEAASTATRINGP